MHSVILLLYFIFVLLRRHSYLLLKYVRKMQRVCISAKECYVFNRIYAVVKKGYNSFRKVWYTERKGNGFEVQDIRFGGLERRLKNCKQILSDYINGEIEKIEELEEDIKQLHEETELSQRNWGKIVTVNSLTHFNFFGI